MNMNNIASIFIEKSILGTSVQILQVGIVFIRDNKFKYFYKYIKNDIKNSNSAIEWHDALKFIDKIIGDKKIILKNDDNNDFKILNNSYKKFLNKDFNNFVYDIAKNSQYLGHKKFNIDYLSSIYEVKFKNNKNLPTSVFKAQKVFAIGSKMFKLGLKNV